MVKYVCIGLYGWACYDPGLVWTPQISVTCRDRGVFLQSRDWAAKPGRKSSICDPHLRAGGSQGGFREALPTMTLEKGCKNFKLLQPTASYPGCPPGNMPQFRSSAISVVNEASPE